MSYIPSRRRIQELTKKIQAGTISEEEFVEFEEWYSSYNDSIVHDFTEKELEEIGETIFKRVDDNLSTDQVSKFYKTHFFKKIIGAAALLTLFLGGYLAYISFHKHESSSIMGGGYNGSVYDDSGNRILLNNMSAGDSISIGGYQVKKIEDGSIAFLFSQDDKKAQTSVVSTPRGGEHRVLLPDGTKVWMNAESKLEFSRNFQEDRKVKLEGEAYFEVQHLSSKPFVVYTKTENIKVLGTKFNVESYSSQNRSITSLTEGAVSIRDEGKNNIPVLLHPGKQFVRRGKEIKIQEFDIDEVLAWKSGEFMFNKVPLEEALIGLARWYDVEFHFISDHLKSKELWGTLSRYDNLEKALGMLAKTGVARFKIEGRRVIVKE